MEMKSVFLIGGTMGVGKTTVCQLLKRRLDRAVFLDGDWCWDADPFQVTSETKQMVEDNICHLLNRFIHCSAYDNVIFCWVLHEQSIIDRLLSRLDLTGCRVTVLSLVCTPDALARRLGKDVAAGLRQPEILERSVQRLPLYDALRTVKLDVSDLTPEEAAGRISALPPSASG